MALTNGSRLGAYEILAPLGAGGMGEVYRARDSRLGREVAIKVLRQDLAASPDRLARFEREARLLASLNHPNIATIYGLEESDGVRFLVMELVPGQTLAERLRGGPLPVAEALAVARQVAEALEAAREKGIIHRDLKPANIQVTPQGKVKLLDFGLGKAFLPEGPLDPLQSTGSYHATREGVILGTPAYMSPEQARGQPLDHRTDVWSFGCVLYEMLSGKRAFPGETTSDTIAAILEREPDGDGLARATPAKVRDVIQRCLRKDPRRRLRDIGDALIDLEDTSLDSVPPLSPFLASSAPSITNVSAKQPGTARRSTFVEQSLMAGERLLCTARMYPGPIPPIVLGVLFLVGCAFLVTGVLFLFHGPVPAGRDFGAILSLSGFLAVPIALYGLAYSLYATTSEFALTNKRIVVKTGMFTRKIRAMPLSRVQAVYLDQGLFGRLMDHGTLVLTGSGVSPHGGLLGLFGSQSVTWACRNIKAPLEFYKRVQEQVALAQKGE